MDGSFSMADYGLADDFFSPLTSPAIEAQVAFSSTGTTASPVDLGADPATISQAATAGTKRRKGNGVTRTPARSVKQSPALKPQPRRRHPSLSSLRLDKPGTLPPPGSPGASQHLSAPNSAVIRPSDDSISPEALPEAAMGPPPVPQPGFTPQNTASNNPVTPATLMSMPTNPSVSAKPLVQHGSTQAADGPMEEIMLPDAAAPTGPPVLSSIDTSKMGEDSDSTPTLSAKSAKLSAASTPRGGLARGMSQETFAKPGKGDVRGAGRASKKRQSTSSATVSPAIRPKISPSINPLAPAPGMY